MSEPSEGASYDKATIDEEPKYKGGQIEGPKDRDDDRIQARLSAGTYYGPVPCEASQNIIMEMVNSPLTPFGQYHKRQLSDAEVDEYIAQANAQTDATD